MKVDIPEDAEFRRLASDNYEKCSFCEHRVGNVARSFDENGINIGNVFFCWGHWAEYLNQEFGEYVGAQLIQNAKGASL